MPQGAPWGGLGGLQQAGHRAPGHPAPRFITGVPASNH